MRNCRTCKRNIICSKMDSYRNMACKDYERAKNKGKKTQVQNLPPKGMEKGKKRAAKRNHKSAGGGDQAKGVVKKPE